MFGAFLFYGNNNLIIKSSMGAFVISQRFNGKYKFTFTSRKGKAIFTSGGYADKEQCEAALAQLQESVDSLTFKKQKTTAGKYFFVILLDDQQIASSRKYSTELRLQKGIDEVNLSAEKAETLDFSDNDFAFTQ